MSQPIIAFDYDFSPFAQKIRDACAISGLSFLRHDEPVVLPRPILEKLGITYRRIPVWTIGKDAYADSTIILKTLQTQVFKKPIPTSPADIAWETFGVMQFNAALRVVSPGLMDANFIKDRRTIFPALTRPDLEQLRPSGLAEHRYIFNAIENQVLTGGGPFINGSTPSMADVHVAWAVRFVLNSMGVNKEPGFGPDAFPRLYKLLDSLPKASYKDLGDDEAVSTVLGSQYTAPDIGVDANDPLGLAAGQKVTVESADAEPGSHPQYGVLVGLDQEQVVLELDTRVRLHFPRLGYVIKKA